MKKYKNYLIAVIFFCSQFAMAMGNGSSLQNKSVSSKDCPEGTEYKIRNKGVRGCYPKDSAEIDPGCDESFFENLEAKQSCLLDINSTACLSLGILGGAAVGGYAGKMLESVINKQTPEVQKKFLAAINEIRTSRSIETKVLDLWQKSRDKAFDEHSKGKFKTEDGWYAAQPKRTSIPDEIQELKKIKELKEIEVQMRKNETALLNSDLPSEIKNSLKNFLKTTYSISDTEMVGKIAKIFPEEGNILRKLYETRSALNNEMSRLNPSYMNGRVYSDNSFRYRELDASIGDINEKIESLTKLNPKFRLVDMLMQNGYPGTFPRIKNRQIFNTAKDSVYIEKHKVKIATEKNGRNGAVAGAALTALALAGSELFGQADIRNCQKDYGFSNSEIEYLGNNHILSVAKAKKTDGWGCENLVLLDPQNLFGDMKEKFGGIPKGICKMVKQQSQNLDKLTGEFNVNPAVSCDKISDTNLSVYKDADASPTFTNNSGKDIFEYRSGSFVYKTPFNEGINYPDFRFIKAFDENGREVRNESLRMQGFYNQLHPANIPDARPDLKDLTSSCSDNSHNANLFCNMKQAAVRARVGRSISSSICSYSDAIVPPSDQVKVKSAGAVK